MEKSKIYKLIGIFIVALLVCSTAFYIFESKADVLGVNSLGFSTTVFPAATEPINGAKASW